MKKILAIVLMTFSASSFAWYHGGYYGGYHGPVYVNNYSNNWVAPALAGAVVGAAIARPYYYAPPAVYASPTVVYTQPPVYIQQAAPAPTAPVGYHWGQIMDPACNCSKYALIPN